MAPKVRVKQHVVGTSGPVGTIQQSAMIAGGSTTAVVGDCVAHNVELADESTGQSNAASGQPRRRGSSEPRTPVASNPQQQEQRFGKRGSGQAFALGLFQILKTEDPSIIGWSTSGKAFRIGDSERFCRDIMPRFFKQNKYSSFQRQLNLYGFRKLVRGNEAGGYMHPLFERGKPEQLSQVRRGFFPEIPPEFAHDVHGHGLGETGPGGDGGSSSSNGTPSRAAPRGRKVEPSSRGSPGALPPGPNGSVAGRLGGAQHARSSSVGRPGHASSMSAAAVAAAGVVAAAATATRGVPNRAGPTGDPQAAGRNSNGIRGGVAAQGRVRQGHMRSGSASVIMGHDNGRSGMSMDTADWDGIEGPLPSLGMVTGGLQLPRGHGNGVSQGGGAEMPPTLGRLVPSAAESRESSPMKSTRDGMHAPTHRHHESTMEPLDRSDGHGHHAMAYGRSQDDLGISPRGHYGHILGMSPHASVGGAGSYYNNGTPGNRGGGHPADYYGSNGSVASGSSNSRRGHRPLQHMHSQDDLDALRPRKTRRTGASYDGGVGDDPAAFFAGSPRQTGDGDEGLGGGEGGSDNGIPFLAAAAVYAMPDELPPAAPRRLVSRHNTPSRPERSGASKNNNGSGRESGGIGVGGAGGSGGRDSASLLHLGDPNAMDTGGGGGSHGGPGGMGLSQGYNLAAQGFYAAVSPVAVPTTRTGFPGGRRHQRHHSSTGSGALVDGFADGGQHRNPGPGWRLGEVSPEEAAVMRGDSPTSSRSGGGGGSSHGAGGGSGGSMGIGGLGLTAHAMSRMEQVKSNRQDTMQPGDATQNSGAYGNGNSGIGVGPAGHGGGTPGGVQQPGVKGVGVQALGENLSQLDLSEARRDSRNQGSGAEGLSNGLDRVGGRGRGGGGGGAASPGVRYDAQGQPRQHQHQQTSKQQQNHHHRPHPHYMQGLQGERGGPGHKRSSGGSKGNGSGEWVPGARSSAAEAAELLRRRSSVDEVIGLLSKPTADGVFEDEGIRAQQHDPAQFDSWRNSLTKVLGHLGFDFQDEDGVPLPMGLEGKRSPAKCISSRGTSQYLSWGGTSAMSFEEQPEEFHESLRQIPMRWRSSLSSIMTSMASTGGGIEEGVGTASDGGAGAVDMEGNGDGKGAGERKQLEQQASLEMLQSVMRETLESMSGSADQVDAQDGEEEAKAAATAALAMGSMCRANANGGGAATGNAVAVGTAGNGATLGSNGSGRGRGGGSRQREADSSRSPADGQPSGVFENGHAPGVRHAGADVYYTRVNGHMHGGGGTGTGMGAPYVGALALQGTGVGGGMQHGEHHTSL